VTSALTLTRALLIPAGALSGALVGAVTGALAALPDASLQSGTTPGFVLLAAALGVAAGGALGAVAGALLLGILLLGAGLLGAQPPRGAGAVRVLWGVVAWLVASAAVGGVLLAAPASGLVRYDADPAAGGAASAVRSDVGSLLAQPLCLAVIASVLLAAGVALERAVLLRASHPHPRP
jgi:hypothetical protein